MPRLPIDYSKTVIYKLCCNDVNIKEIYIGHTTDLIRRKSQHKYSCINEKNKGYNHYKYQFIRTNGGWDNWSLTPIEEFPCSNINQASIRERYWIETLQAELNKYIPSRTIKEWVEINKDKKKEYDSKNKEKIKEYDKNYREYNKSKKKEYNKEYYQNKKIYDFVIFMKSF